jgi:hypothetical protein
MRSIINEHFDIIVVGGIAVLLVAVYVLLLAARGVTDEALKTLMISTVGGAVGLATGRKRSEANVSTERGDVVVRQSEPQ